MQLMTNLSNKITRTKILLLTALLCSGSAFATGPDVTAITAVVADVGVVAAAVFGVYVAIKAAKFIRRAL